MAPGRRSDRSLLQDLLLYAASIAFSCLVLAGLKQLNPNRDTSKKSIANKNAISKRLGRPLIHTDPYEVLQKEKEKNKIGVYNYIEIGQNPLCILEVICFSPIKCRM